jgi:hypothetical protein
MEGAFVGNLTSHRVARMSACRADLLESGIDLSEMVGTALEDFVHEHLEYFQAMLADDSSVDEVEALVLHERRVYEGALRIVARTPVTIPNDAEPDLEGKLARAERRREAMAHMSLEELLAAATELRRRSAEVIEQMEAVQERFEALHL